MKSAAPPRRLPSADEIIDAATWRLAGWTTEQIETATDELAQLRDAGHELTGDDPAIAALLQRLRRPGDRRDPWSAACALAVFLADARSDAAVFWSAGVEVLQSWRQAQRGQHRPPGDALDDLIAENLRRRPAMSAREMWEHFRGLAVTGVTCIDEADDQRLTYEQTGPNSTRERTVSWHAFEVRVSRARDRLAHEALQPTRVEVEADPLGECMRAWRRTGT